MSEQGGELRKIIHVLRLAFAFLTVLPVRFEETITNADLAASRFAFPVVGGILGVILAVLSVTLERAGAAPGVAAFLLITVGVAITGGLHLDGLADTADGLFLHGGSERRLSVMRDPHVGSFGVAAIVLVLLGKYAVLGAMHPSMRLWGIFGASLISRSLILVSAGLAPYARPEGTGRVLVEASTTRDAQLGAAVVLAASVVVAGVPGLFAAGVVLGLAVVLTRHATVQLGGVTGDTLGALVEAGELVTLIAFSLAASRA